MKKYIIGLLFCSLAGIAMSQSNAREAAVNAVPVHTITLPLERTVYQRVNNEATIRLAGQLRTIRFISQVQYKVEKLDKYGTVTGIQTDWTSLALNPIILSGGLFSTTLNNVPTGWYNVQIRTRLGFTGSLYEYSAPTKFGIGEVLFFAGQSNAQGAPLDLAGGTPTFSGQPYDCISAINQNCWCKNTYQFPEFSLLTKSSQDTYSRIAPNGNQNVWCYEALGRKLVDQAEISEGKVVPIVVFKAQLLITGKSQQKMSKQSL
ncbi:MAG TPA: hypothetical protein DCM71_04300 [Runella sp.]|nr:hypothetical protein [Runella sp.]